MQGILPTIAVQFDVLEGVGGVVVAIAASFVIITLVASYYRFQHIVEQAEEVNPEEIGADAQEILRVQLARYLAGCARRGTSFSLFILQVREPGVLIQMDAPLVQGVKDAARRDDVVCVFDEGSLALLAESEPEDAENIIRRIMDSLARQDLGLTPSVLRAGIASYPGHGLSGKDLIATAEGALSETSMERPALLPEIEDVDADEEDASAAKPVVETESDDDEKAGWRERRRNRILDELTGVLRPSSISAFMQRMMSDLRYKKKKAALFCIGVNNMDHLARYHGQDAANDVLVGVSKILQKHLRSDDLIGRHEKYAFLVLAECTIEQAEVIGKRISTLVQQTEFESEGKKLKTTITLGVATYPEHGRNLHQLYMAGQKVLDHSRENDIRAYAVYDPEIHATMPSKPMRSIKSVQA